MYIKKLLFFKKIVKYPGFDLTLLNVNVRTFVTELFLNNLTLHVKGKNFLLQKHRTTYFP